MSYLDSVCFSSKMVLTLAVCVMAAIATIELITKDGPNVHLRRRAWTIALGICVALTVLFPSNGAQYHQLESLVIKFWHICTCAAAADIMAYALMGGVYLGIAWIIPIMLPIEFKHKLLCILAMHGLCLFLWALSSSASKYDKQQKLDEQRALVNQIRQAIAEYSERPGIECTIGGPNGNAISIGPRHK